MFLDLVVFLLIFCCDSFDGFLGFFYILLVNSCGKAEDKAYADPKYFQSYELQVERINVDQERKSDPRIAHYSHCGRICPLVDVSGQILTEVV